MSFMNKLVAVAAGMLAILGVASADVYVPGTTVSYDASREQTTGNNTGTVFLDEVNDTLNKTYVELSCQDGAFVFYLNAKDPLYTLADYKAETLPTLRYRVDAGGPRTVETVTVGEDDKPDLNVLAVPDEFDAQMLAAFRSGQSKVVIQVLRPGLRELTYTFPLKGLTQAIAAVKNCR